MPSRKASIKDLKKSKKRQQRNILLKKTLKKAEKNIATLLANKDTAKLKNELSGFISILDKSVGRNIIHKNKASREKSRITKKINKLSAPKKSPATAKAA